MLLRYYYRALGRKCFPTSLREDHYQSYKLFAFALYMRRILSSWAPLPPRSLWKHSRRVTTAAWKAVGDIKKRRHPPFRVCGVPFLTWRDDGDGDDGPLVVCHKRTFSNFLARARLRIHPLVRDCSPAWRYSACIREGRRTFATIESRCRSIAFSCLPYSAGVHALDKFGNICIRTNRRLRLCKHELFYLVVSSDGNGYPFTFQIYLYFSTISHSSIISYYFLLSAFIYQLFKFLIGFIIFQIFRTKCNCLSDWTAFI